MPSFLSNTGLKVLVFCDNASRGYYEILLEHIKSILQEKRLREHPDDIWFQDCSKLQSTSVLVGTVIKNQSSEEESSRQLSLDFYNMNKWMYTHSKAIIRAAEAYICVFGTTDHNKMEQAITNFATWWKQFLPDFLIPIVPIFGGCGHNELMWVVRGEGRGEEMFVFH